MFCYQKNTKDLSAVKCSRKDFWREIRRSSTDWLIDSRRDVMRAVQEKDQEGMERWAAHTDFKKFDLRALHELKTATAKERWKKRTLEKKLLAWADDLKKTLPVFTFCCTGFDEVKYQPKAKKGEAQKEPRLVRRRQLKGCHLNGLVMLDIDHVENPVEIWEQLARNHELMCRVVLVHITSSGRGIRIVFKAEKADGNLADNQIVFAQAIGYKADRSCIDASRNSFAPKESDILFVDEEQLFTYYDEEYDKLYTPAYREGKTEPLHHSFDAEDKADGGHPAVPASLTFKGRPYGDIIDHWWQRQGGVPQEGERNVRLYQLATNLRAICDNNQELLLQVMPRLGLEEQELERIVESACKEPVKGISKTMQEILNGEASKPPGQETATATQPSSLEAQLWAWGKEIEAMMQDFPELRDVCKGLKQNQYTAALFVSGGLMMTLMTRCTYRFYHRPEELRRLNNSTLIIGDPASGKSFATRLYKLLAAPIAEADQAGKDAINAYRELMKTKGANKDKPKKPKVVIRIHPARTSNAQFIQDMVNAVEVVDGKEMQLHMLTFDTELDNTLTLQRGGAYIDKQALELKAFHNEEDGQFYANLDSVMQNFYVIWNFIYTGTPLALKKKVNEQNFGSGLATRLTCIPLPATNFEMLARQDNADLESDERLREWAYRLDKVKGELTLGKIVDELYDWTSRRMMDAKDNDSRADEMLLKRCAYHGLNFAAPFIVMRHWQQLHQDGQYWCGEFDTDDTDWRLAELIVNIQYACQRHYFGAMAEAYFDNKLKDASVNTQRRQKTYEGFQRLPEVFTVEDVVRCFGLDNASAAYVKVKRLMDDHVVEKIGNYVENGSAKAKYKKRGVLI